MKIMCPSKIHRLLIKTIRKAVGISRVFCICAAAGLGAMVIMCNNDSGTDPKPPTLPPPARVIFSEGFEGNNLDSSGFRVAYRGTGYGLMSITYKAAHNGSKYSLMSDSNQTGIRKLLPVDQFIQDSIAGLEFYLMASAAGKTEVYAAFGQGGNSLGMLPNGWQTVFGMGIDKSDSLWCLYQRYSYPQVDTLLVHKTCGALKTNKWYKCNIEYDFNAEKLTWYLDNVPVFSKSAPNRPVEEFIVYRDTLGGPGPKDYFFDDITVYKR